MKPKLLTKNGYCIVHCNITHSKEFSENQAKHQNFEPTILPYKFEIFKIYKSYSCPCSSWQEYYKSVKGHVEDPNLIINHLYSPTIIVTGIAIGTPIAAQISFGLSIGGIAASPSALISADCTQDWIEVNTNFSLID